MSYTLTLIDKAGKVCGSFYKLSKEIDMAESTISQIRKGKRPLPFDVVPILASITREDVDEAMRRVLLEQAVGTRREGALREILGKGLVAGVAAMSLFSYSGKSNADTGNQSKIDGRLNVTRIVLPKLGRFRRLIRWAGNRLRSTSQHPQAGPVKTV